MTILVAVKKNGRVFLGADRITTFGNEYHTDLVGGQKLIKLKNAYVATTGYTLLDNVIEHLVTTNHKMIENPFANRDDVFAFFLELYGELKKGYTLVDTGKDTYAGIHNQFLVVTPSNIYGVSSNLSVAEFPDYGAKGAGQDFALGCLYGLYETVDDGFELVRLALEAACHFNVYCRGPLDILEVTAADLSEPHIGYKTFGAALRTLPKRDTAGDLRVIINDALKRTVVRSKSGPANVSPAKTASKPVASGRRQAGKASDAAKNPKTSGARRKGR